MCGICGAWSESGVGLESVRAMAARIHHRGPDDEGFFVRPNIAMANRRLSIIDLNSGKQPISNEDETIHIVFNGEIYNFQELRQDLIERGHRFRTQTDTEVIVHLYEEYQTECVGKLNGMFAFALWDERAQRLFLARDPLGQKPLYYTQVGSHFVFGSEIKALLEYPGVVPKLNLEAMHDCLSLRCIPGQATLFQGIEKVPAGHWISLDRGKLTEKRYWDLRYTPKLEGSVEEIRGHLLELLESTVASHMISDAPLGAFLSGGLDSSLIVALMARASDRPINTFSIGVTETSFDELPYAREMAQHCGANHHEAKVRPDLISMLPDMIYHMEEPIDPFAFGVHSVAQLASGHVKVVLGGDGGDEMFAGYDRYVGNQLVDIYCSLPQVVRRRVLEPLINRLPDSYRYNNRVQKLRWLVAMSRESGGRRYAESACFLRFNHARKESIYTEQLWDKLGGSDSAVHLFRLFDSDNAQTAVDRMLYTDVKSRLAEHLLMVGDRMTMAHGIEGRSPLVDRRVAEFVAAIPSNMKIRGRQLKYIQREVSRGLVPDSLIARKKQGFSFPLAYWFKNELRETTAMLFREGQMASQGYFRSSAMLSMLDEHVSGQVDHNYRLWLLLNMELWHRLYIGGQSKSELETMLRESMGAAEPVPVGER